MRIEAHYGSCLYQSGARFLIHFHLGVYATGTIMPAVLRFNLFDDFCSKILNHAWIYVLLGIDKPYPNNVWFYIKNLNPTVKFGSVL